MNAITTLRVSIAIYRSQNLTPTPGGRPPASYTWLERSAPRGQTSGDAAANSIRLAVSGVDIGFMTGRMTLSTSGRLPCPWLKLMTSRLLCFGYTAARQSHVISQAFLGGGRPTRGTPTHPTAVSVKILLSMPSDEVFRLQALRKGASQNDISSMWKDNSSESIAKLMCNIPYVWFPASIRALDQCQVSLWRKPVEMMHCAFSLEATHCLWPDTYTTGT